MARTTHRHDRYHRGLVPEDQLGSGTPAGVLGATGTGSAAWRAYATTAEIADVAATESAGTSATVARGDHQHALGIGTTKGDLIAWTASGPTRQAVGADGTALIASSASATGLTWAVPFRAQGVHVRLTTDQTIPNTTLTTVIYQTVDRDDSADISYNTGTGVFTVTTAGWYLITAAAMWLSNNTGTRFHAVRVNAAQTVSDRRAAMGGSESTITTALYLATNDQVDVVVYQSSGGNLALIASYARTRCSVVRIG